MAGGTASVVPWLVAVAAAAPAAAATAAATAVTPAAAAVTSPPAPLSRYPPDHTRLLPPQSSPYVALLRAPACSTSSGVSSCFVYTEQDEQSSLAIGPSSPVQLGTPATVVVATALVLPWLVAAAAAPASPATTATVAVAVQITAVSPVAAARIPPVAPTPPPFALPPVQPKPDPVLAPPGPCPLPWVASRTTMAFALTIQPTHARASRSG